MTTPEELQQQTRKVRDKHLERYKKIGSTIGGLVDEKNAAYGDSFFKAGACLREMYPDGVKPEQYNDMLCLVRILDKMFRIATDKKAFGESPYGDIAGYGILGYAQDSELKLQEKGGKVEVSDPVQKFINTVHLDPAWRGHKDYLNKKQVEIAEGANDDPSRNE